MTPTFQLWPRLPAATANAMYRGFADPTVEGLASAAMNHHPSATYPATGGRRVAAITVENLAADLRTAAMKYGYPEPAGAAADRVAFDRDGAEIIHREMRVTTVDAAARGIWNFLALAAMPDVVYWRFGYDNRERWIASDLTRHMFARLWWQALTFAVPDSSGGFDYGLLRRLSERDLNQITERRRIGGNTRLARILAAVAVDSPENATEILRSITPTLRRHIAFVDFSALTDDQIEAHIRSMLPPR